jgi:hypothetical protein
VSFDVFVQGFRQADATPLPSAPFHAVFGPYVDRTVPEQEFWHITTPDGGDADIYVDAGGETFTSLLINHFTAGQVLDLLARFAERANAVIMPVGGPILVPAPGLLDELPAELLEPAPLVVETGEDIEAAFRTGVA